MVSTQRSEAPVRVLGIDPGTVRTGWGVIERRERVLHFCAAGTITTTGFHSLPERLRLIHTGIVSVINAWTPHILSLEKAFLAYNVQSAFRLGEARGVALLAAAQAGLRIAEYSATEIKTAVVGYGRAEKLQVQKAVFALLKDNGGSKTPEVSLGKDATDALAAAICHFNTSRLAEKMFEAEGRRTTSAYRGYGQRRSLRSVAAQLLAAAKSKPG
jgi:crossover junction endodeoxyribonuclease RuvC